ncbi:hypothetical protein BJX64DRAFT_290987 [Aspergillus heterothallicus]
MLDTNTTNCTTYTGAHAPNITNDYFCFIPLTVRRNESINPLDALSSCCQQFDQSVARYGLYDCLAYCNATEDTVEELGSCLMSSEGVSEYGCSSGAGRGVGRVKGWGIWVMVGLVGWSVLG